MGRAAALVLCIAGLLAAACRAEHASSPGSGTARPVLVAIGASDAVGIGATNPDRDNWVSQLANRLPGGTRAVNLGISGATTAQALQQELPVAEDAAPGVAVVWLGVNDLQARVPLDAFRRDLAAILNGLRTAGSPRVFVGNLPDLRLLGAFQGRDPAMLDAQVTAWNAAIAQVARDTGAILVDIHSAWATTRDPAGLISADGLHPTTAGYARLADLFWQSIQAKG